MTRAEVERALSRRSIKMLVADKGRISGATREPLRRCVGPGKEVTLIDQRARQSALCKRCRLMVLLDSYRIRMLSKKSAVAA
jgi:hypothetical protein